MFGGGGVEPGGAVDLGESGGFAASRGPFDFEGVGVDRVGVDVGLDSPGVDDLASLLFDRLKLEEIAGDLETGLFFELASGGGERVFVVELALWDRPHAVVLLCVERPARMYEKDLYPGVSFPVNQ